MTGWRLAAVGLGVLLSGLAVDAHHAIGAVYDNRRQATLDGVITEFQFVNPHPLVILEVGRGRTATKEWTLEMDNRWELMEVGFTAETLKLNDRILVSGFLSRGLPHRLYVQTLVRSADGFRYQHSE